MIDIKSKEDIILLVDAFYKKALIDPKIGYFFTEVAPLNFADHLPRRYNFWEPTLLGKATFKGNPILKHLELHSKSPLTAAHFERWPNYGKRPPNHFLKAPMPPKQLIAQTK
ncbi:MAG: hemoglobin [Patiriisocius sp.]|jgi:hemoglobin